MHISFSRLRKPLRTSRRNTAALCTPTYPVAETREDYRVEACMAELSEAEREARPYCVAWNVVDEGPIQPDTLPEV